MTAEPSAELGALLGNIDIYLFDQILRGRFDRRRRILDAGCGDGRNLRYFLQRGYTCFGIDADGVSIQRTRSLAANGAPSLPEDNFQIAALDAIPLEDGSVDAVICSAVLHFADNEDHFGRMVRELWRVLAAGGLLFVRLASNIGLEARIGPARTRVRLPDGTERFVVDETMLMEWTHRLGAELADPIKTTNVQQQRCMTTWCVTKMSGPAGRA